MQQSVGPHLYVLLQREVLKNAHHRCLPGEQNVKIRSQEKKKTFKSSSMIKQVEPPVSKENITNVCILYSQCR